MSIGKIAEFKVQSDDWPLYIERLEQYFLVNKIPKELEVPTLITVMGAECYELVVNLCTPTKPKNKTFSEITDIVQKHLKPKPSELAERYKFRHRKQKYGETISEYTAVLKKMSKTCEFGPWLEESLRDQLVCGISNETIRQRLFAESDLDFGKAYKLAVSMEAAEKDAAAVEGHVRPNTEPASVECQAMSAAGARHRGAVRTAHGLSGAVQAGDSRGTRRRAAPAQAGRAGPVLAERAQRQCQVCGGRHDGATCKFKRYVCRVCNRQGHLQRMCPNSAGQHSVNVIREEESLSDSADSEEFQIL